MIVKNFPNVTKDMDLHIQETQGILSKINSKKSTSKHTAAKLLKTKDNGNTLESSQRKMVHYLKGNTNQIIRFLISNPQR